MNFKRFCEILNDNLVYELSPNVSEAEGNEWYNELYTIFKEAYHGNDNLTDEQRVVSWMREHFSGCSFDTHNFQLKSHK